MAYPTLLLVNLSATWFMVGLIWLVQLVHYPLFARVGSEQWTQYHREHARQITYVVAPVMFVELTTSVLLPLLAARARGVGSTEVGPLWLAAGLTAAVWASTAFLQVPQHNRLTNEFDARTVAALVSGNWIRTLLWSARGLILAYLAWCRIAPE